MISAICNAIAFVFFVGACVLLIVRKKNTRLTVGEWATLLIAILLYAFVSCSNMLEHFSITAYFDPAEDIAEIAFILIFVFFIYNWRKQSSIYKIQEQEIWLNETLQSIADGVMTTDRNGVVQQLNTVMESLTGWSNDEAVSKNARDVLSFVNKNTGETVDYDPFGNALANTNESSKLLSLMIKSRDGKTTSINEKTALISNKNKSVMGAVGIFRDMSEYDSIMEQLTHVHKMEAVGQLAGGVAHDVNNMLGGIMGAADLLSSKFSKDERTKYSNELDILFNASERAADLTSNLLSFSRKGKILTSPVSIAEILNSTITIVKSTVCKTIPMNLDLCSDDLSIIGDPTQLQNAFLNLILNAKDAVGDKGEISISTGKVYLDESQCIATGFEIFAGEYVLISIQDNGEGISPEVKQHIFEPFFTTKVSGKGTGLGLSAVFGTVVSHHGAIEVVSSEECGTCFKLYFPLSEEDVNASESISKTKHIKNSDTVLVIEDEAIIQSSVKMILEESGYSVLIASDGMQGIELFKKNRDDIAAVLLDLVMPGASGQVVLEELLDIEPNVKVIMTSGFIPANISERCAGFVGKPYRRDILTEKLAEVINNFPKTDT